MLFENLGIIATTIAGLAIFLYVGRRIEKAIKKRVNNTNKEKLNKLVDDIRKERPMPNYIHVDDFLTSTKHFLKLGREEQVKRLIEQTNIYYVRRSNSLNPYHASDELKRYEQEKEDKGIRYSLIRA